MTEILAVFRSRSQAIDCNSRLKRYGISATLINTPKEANVGVRAFFEVLRKRANPRQAGYFKRELFRVLRVLYDEERLRQNVFRKSLG